MLLEDRYESCLSKDFKVSARSWLRHAHSLRDQGHTHPLFYRVCRPLICEIFMRFGE